MRFQEIFEDMGDNWRLQEVPCGYYIWQDGEYYRTSDGQPVTYPTRAEAVKRIAEIRAREAQMVKRQEAEVAKAISPRIGLKGLLAKVLRS